MHAYIHTYRQTDRHPYVRVYVCMHAGMYACMSVCVCVCIYTYIYIYITEGAEGRPASVNFMAFKSTNHRMGCLQILLKEAAEGR